MKVTVTNYIFPIHFSYRGWYVKLEKRTAFFSTLSVEAIFTPFSMYDSIIREQNLVKSHISNSSTAINNSVFAPFHTLFQVENFDSSDYSLYLHASNSYLKKLTPFSPRTERFSANSYLDNFMGSNTSATKKLLEKVEDYMNTHLPFVESDKSNYLTYLKNHGVNSSIISFITLHCCSKM